MMTAMAPSKAPTSINRRRRRHAGGTWASAHAANELDDALLRMLAMAAEMPASIWRKAGSRLALCRALSVRSLRDLPGPPCSALMSSCSWFKYRAARYAASLHRICFGSDDFSGAYSARRAAAVGHTAVGSLAPGGQSAAIVRPKGKDVVFGHP